jgi:hypothetical protein
MLDAEPFLQTIPRSRPRPQPGISLVAECEAAYTDARRLVFDSLGPRTDWHDLQLSVEQDAAVARLEHAYRRLEAHGGAEL